REGLASVRQVRDADGGRERPREAGGADRTGREAEGTEGAQAKAREEGAGAQRRSGRAGRLPGLPPGQGARAHRHAGRVRDAEEAALTRPLPPFTEAHEELRAEIRRFIAEELRPHAAEWEAAEWFPDEGFHRM